MWVKFARQGMSAKSRLAWLAAAVLAVVEAGLLLTQPATAQIRDDRYPFLERRPGRQAPQPQLDPFGSWRGPGYDRRPRSGYVDRGQSDPSRPPAARKPDVPPTMTIAVVGDSMAEWLAFGLEEAFSDNSDLGILRRIRSSAGLIRNEDRRDSFDWAKADRDLLAKDKPDFVVIMVGVADRQSIRERPALSGQAAGSQDQPAIMADAPSLHEFRSERWTELYSKRIDDTITALKNKGVPVLWVGLPPIRGARSKTEVTYINDLYRARAEKAGVPYVDIWDGFVDEEGNFNSHGPDYNGQIRRLRSGDGMHFTQSGAVKLGHYVEREMQRLLVARTAPVALPDPQSQQPAVRPGTVRPVAGPVVPLTGKTAVEDLAGAAATTVPAIDPVANRVLIRGDTVLAPTGRADDFGWPRRDATADNNEVLPVAPPTPAAAGPRPTQPKAPPTEQRPAPRRPGQAGQAAANPAR
jgi:uncharacterized protein